MNLIAACEKSLHDKGVDLNFINLNNCISEFHNKTKKGDLSDYRNKIKNKDHPYYPFLWSFFNKYLLREKGIIENFISAINKDLSNMEETLSNKNITTHSLNFG
jgi:hypothetical protein